LRKRSIGFSAGGISAYTDNMLHGSVPGLICFSSPMADEIKVFVDVVVSGLR
jgi:hypothetical protein